MTLTKRQNNKSHPVSIPSLQFSKSTLEIIFRRTLLCLLQVFFFFFYNRGVLDYQYSFSITGADRCGKIDETTDKAFGMDLCEKCTNDIWNYADKGRQPIS